jgi:hypothetical protein
MRIEYGSNSYFFSKTLKAISIIRRNCLNFTLFHSTLLFLCVLYCFLFAVRSTYSQQWSNKCRPPPWLWRPGSSFGIATDYGQDGPGIESRRGRDFSHTSRPALGPTQPPVQWVPGLFREVKWPRRGADHQPLLAPRSRMSRAIPLLLLLALGGLL